jgi:hypothetical protein
MRARRAPRCRNHVGPGRAGEPLNRWADGETEPPLADHSSTARGVPLEFRSD